MGIFRSSTEVRTAQAALNTYSDAQRRAGNHEETDEYLTLNDAVNDAYRNDKANRRGKRHS